MWEEALAAKVETLARGAGLEFRRLEVALEPGEPYAEVEGPRRNTLYFEPAEFADRQLPAIVWRYSYPTMRRVRLVGPGEKGDWQIQSSDGVPFHHVLSPDSLRDLVIDLSQRVA